jgi:hypothetical protein
LAVEASSGVVIEEVSDEPPVEATTAEEPSEETTEAEARAYARGGACGVLTRHYTSARVRDAVSRVQVDQAMWLAWARAAGEGVESDPKADEGVESEGEADEGIESEEWRVVDGASSAELKGLQIERLMGLPAGILDPDAVQMLKELRATRDRNKPGPRSTDARRNVYESLCRRVATGTVEPPVPPPLPLGKWALDF